jgi:hypothetical protein
MRASRLAMPEGDGKRLKALALARDRPVILRVTGTKRSLHGSAHVRGLRQQNRMRGTCIKPFQER